MINIKNKAQSSFVSYISVKDNSKINAYLSLKIKPFFDVREISSYKPITENTEIADLDFKKTEFSYFYDVIFYDIAKNKGQIEFSIKYCITLDKQNCPNKCDKTGLLYDEIRLHNKPVFYFLYIDIEEIFTQLRTHTFI